MRSNDWQKYRIENILSKVIDNRGKNPPFSESGYPYIDTTCIVGENRHPDYSLVRKFISSATYANWFRSGHPRRNDLLIATVGANIGKICLMDDTEACIAQNAIGLRINEEVANPIYVYYLLNSDEIQSLLKSLDVGSAQPSIKVPHLLNVSLDLPSIPVQCRIADILSALDDKIELNRQTNATLEAIAKSIFREWFVDGEDINDWEVGKLGDIAENIRRSVQPSEIEPDTPYIGLEHMPRKSIALSEWDTASDVMSNKYQFKQDEFLFGKLRPYFHKVGVAPLDGVSSTDILVVAPKEDDYYGVVLGHISSVDLINHTTAASTGTKMPRTNWSDIARYEIALPPKERAKQFSGFMKSVVQLIQSNIMEARTLANIRDTLLPKLMSGEIEVTNN